MSYDGYGQSNTREYGKEVLEKLALIDAMADEYASHRDFSEFVLRKVSSAGSAALDQISTWTSFLESLPYRRESGEVLRNPNLVAGVGSTPQGGDCDDLTVVALAGLKVLGLPCMPEILASDKDQGFHVRAIVGLPAINPTEWHVIDPVWWSEAQWARSTWSESKNLSPALQKTVTVSADPKDVAQASYPQQMSHLLATLKGNEDASGTRKQLLFAAVAALLILVLWKK